MNPGERSDLINKRWDETKNSQQAQLDGQYIKTKAELENQLNKTSQYKGMRNQASANHAMQERARKEQMANMGMSGAGGTSRTFQQRNTNNLHNQIGSINQQEQDYKNNVNLALGNLKTQYDSNLASINAQNNAQRNAELLSDDQWYQGHALQKDQFDRTFGLQIDQFEEGQRQFDSNLGLQRDQFDESKRQFNSNFGLQEKQYKEGQRQFNSNFGLQERQFEESQTQFDQNYLLSKDRAKLEKANALRQTGRISRSQYRDIVNGLLNY